jgi:hypothetical protein
MRKFVLISLLICNIYAQNLCLILKSDYVRVLEAHKKSGLSNPDINELLKSDTREGKLLTIMGYVDH